MTNEKMDSIPFSEDEIQSQLAGLGYVDIPKQRIREFKRDLDHLIRYEKSKDQTPIQWDPWILSSSSKSSPDYVQNDETALKRPKGTSPAGRWVPFSAFGADNFSLIEKQCEFYSQYLVAANSLQPSTASCQLVVVNNPTNDSNSLDTSKYTNPKRDGVLCEKHVKRKVIRKRGGQYHVCDESTFSEDMGELEHQLDELRVSASLYLDSELESEAIGSLNDTTSFKAEDDSGVLRSCRENIRPKSFIRPQLDHPHTRHLKKSDPVSKYLQYKQDWETCRPPGEEDRKGLRWKIREQMMHKSQPPSKPQRVCIPNTYMAPTEKKRLALRWEVRYDLANGILSPKTI